MDAHPKTEVTVAVVVLSSSRNLEVFFLNQKGTNLKLYVLGMYLLDTTG